MFIGGFNPYSKLFSKKLLKSKTLKKRQKTLYYTKSKGKGKGKGKSKGKSKSKKKYTRKSR